MIRLLAVLGLSVLTACTSTPDVTRVADTSDTLPSLKTFSAVRATPSRVSNAEFARDFLKLSFELETGRQMPVLARFSGPITIRLTGTGLRSVTSHDLDQLITRLRDEAKLPVARVGPKSTASITVELVPARALQRAAPSAACFVVPNVSSWAGFQQRRRSAMTDWAELRERTQMAVFIPSSSSPQEIRDCLHEEIAQALGPVNDLFELPNSVFNDDNFHAVLTGFDMEVLRVFYHPSLANGMTREQVAARLPAILASVRPQAPVARQRPDPGFTPDTWTDAIARALGPGQRAEDRVQSAQWALGTARSMGWRDTRLGFSLYAYGRLNSLRNPDAAIAAFSEAERLFAVLPGTEIQRAHIAVHTAAFALATGRFETAIAIADENIPFARKGQNASLLSTLMMIKAAALEATGNPAPAKSIRLDSLGWARYAFASEADIQMRLSEINEMVPKWRRGGAT